MAITLNKLQILRANNAMPLRLFRIFFHVPIFHFVPGVDRRVHYIFILCYTYYIESGSIRTDFVPLITTTGGTNNRSFSIIDTSTYCSGNIRSADRGFLHCHYCQEIIFEMSAFVQNRILRRGISVFLTLHFFLNVVYSWGVSGNHKTLKRVHDINNYRIIESSNI